MIFWILAPSASKAEVQRSTFLFFLWWGGEGAYQQMLMHIRASKWCVGVLKWWWLCWTSHGSHAYIFFCKTKKRQKRVRKVRFSGFGHLLLGRLKYREILFGFFCVVGWGRGLSADANAYQSLQVVCRGTQVVVALLGLTWVTCIYIFCKAKTDQTNEWEKLDFLDLGTFC